jgi:hypothetical protein
VRRRWAGWPHSVCLRRLDLRNRTPSPPPFSSMNSMPPPSNATRIFATVSPRPPSCPSADSSRAIVGSDTPERRANSPCDHPSSARAALTCRMVINRTPQLIEFLLTLLESGINRISIIIFG